MTVMRRSDKLKFMSPIADRTRPREGTMPPDPSEIARFAKLVKLMRQAQHRYFDGDRSPASISQAKDLERRVDRAVTWILGHRQPGLTFGQDKQGGNER